MSLDSPLAFAFLALAVLVLSVARTPRAQRVAFLGLSLAFLALQYQGALPSLAVLVAVTLVHYALLAAMLGSAPATRERLFAVWLAITIAGFTIAKKYTWLVGGLVPASWLAHDLTTTGWSFILFRQVHLAMLVRDGERGSVDPLSYGSWIFALWTLLAGPLQSFEDHENQRSKMEASAAAVPTREVLQGLNRAMFGYLKMLVASSVVAVHGDPSWLARHPSFPLLAGFLIAKPLALYWNFSGYSDIVIGLAGACGFALPENFQHPYAARNSVEFWNRWHISLSGFIRDHLYFPLQVMASRRFTEPVAAVLAPMVSFVVMGLWHGNTPGFLVFGLMHGLGVVATNSWGRLLKRRLGRDGHRAYLAHRGVHLAAVFLCQLHVLLAFLPFHYTGEQIRLVARTAAGLVGLR